MRHWLLCSSLVLLCGLWPTTAAAESRKPIEFEMYSWKSGTHWRYAVFEGTSTQRSAEKIQSKSTMLKDLNFLKGRLAKLPGKETVYWRVDLERGFILPSKETIQEVQDYAEGLQLKVLLPGDRNVKDPIDKILQ